ncbi:uncharacterized protein METZ01_LOCUS474107, partial [marine metagenome]
VFEPRRASSWRWSIKSPAGRRHIIVLSWARIEGTAPAEADIDTVWQVEQT